jgi:hypothetical protein
MQTVAAGDLSGGKNLLRGEFTVDLRPEMYLSATSAPVGDDDAFYRNGSGDFVYTTDLVGTEVDSGDEGQNTARVYYPVGYAPPGGWPTVAWVINSGFQTSVLSTGDTDGDSLPTTGTQIAAFIDAGYAVVQVRVNPAADLTDDLGQFRNATDSQYTDSDNPKAQKDVVWLMQYLRQYGYERHGLNPNRIAIGGQSGGAGTAAWVAWNTDFADPTSSIPMLRQSSVPNAFISYAMPAYFPIYAASIGGAWFQSTGGNPGGIATNQGDAPNAQRRSGSPIKWFLDSDEALAQWAQMPMFLQWGEAITTFTFEQETPTDFFSLPAIPGVLATNTHDGWNHYMLSIYHQECKKRFGAQADNKRFNFSDTVTGPLSGIAPTTASPQGYLPAELEDTTITDADEIEAAIVDWLRTTGLPGPNAQGQSPDINVNAWLETVS